MMIIIIQLFYLPAVGKQVVGKTSFSKGTTGSIHDNVDDEIGNDIFRLGIFSH